MLGREADELQGFHGTHPDNVLSITEGGFDAERRSGQVFGSGEYFARCPAVSEGYCRDGEYMLVCRLSLGLESSTMSNSDGDHIWVPEQGYYVVSMPMQILPCFIVKFRPAGTAPPQSAELERALRLPNGYSTKKEAGVGSVPPNRPCRMSMPSTDVLWMGFLHVHHSDEQLERDVRAFLAAHGREYCSGRGLRVHIAKGTFKKAHVHFPRQMPRELVHQLNKLPFVEGGHERTICVEDGHGSPEQKCPRWIASYCRGQNLRYTHACHCWHPQRPTDRARFQLVPVDLNGAKGNEIITKFQRSAPFHDGVPHVIKIDAVRNDVLAKLHEEYRLYLKQKNGEEPAVRELYHGTNNKILDVVYTHGLQPPSDCQASDACPVSGGKGLSTSLCSNTCKHCVERHEWDRCHMFGLGIYLADMSQKSHRYCSQPQQMANGRRRFSMVVCSVLGRALEVAGHLTEKDAMHDVPNVRALAEDLAHMVEPHRQGCTHSAPVEQHDLLFVKGLGHECRPGFSVFNSEFIAFHPHQCLPRYQITYEV